MSVASGHAWLELQERSAAFDTANKAHATAVDREAARLVSHSQTGAGAWLRRLPDGSVKGSVVPFDVFISAMQRRLGLYISVLRPGLDGAHDRAVTQHERREPHVTIFLFGVLIFLNLCQSSCDVRTRRGGSAASSHRGALVLVLRCGTMDRTA